MWFYESLHSGIKFGLEGRLVCKKQTKCQDCRIYETPVFGKILVLDGIIQTAEADEFIYHEMLSHPLLVAHDKPMSVLVIGAGDGGVLREVLKHKVERVVLVEIDEDVIKFSKQHLNFLNKGVFGDKRLEVVIEDGAKFIRRTTEKFDIVIIDSSDPVGPSKILFSGPFYRNVHSLLTENGMMIRQTGSIMLQAQIIRKNYKLVKKIFSYSAVQLAAIPTYIGGFFSFLIGGKGLEPGNISYRAISERYERMNLKTKYYNPDIHFSSRKLPNHLKEVIK